MDKLSILKRVQELYKGNNINISEYLREISGEKINSSEDIMISYDFQAGTYIEDYVLKRDLNDRIISRLARTIGELCEKGGSILECGVGEATTLESVIRQNNYKFDDIFGIDISWSRVKYGQVFIESEAPFTNVQLAVGDMFSLPFEDATFDVVYTKHAVEPNRDKEKTILRELYRVSKQYVVLVEPAYELADSTGKQHMDKYKYIRGIYDSAKSLGYNILLWELYGINDDDENPSGIMIIQKERTDANKTRWACPVVKRALNKYDGFLFCEESLLAYPIVNNVPILTRENAVVATKMMGFIDDSKR